MIFQRWQSLCLAPSCSVRLLSRPELPDFLNITRVPMSRRVKLVLRTSVAAVLLLIGGRVPPAQAQTVVVLDAPDSEVRDGFIRGGTYANTVFDNGVLVTKANSNDSFRRHTLLKFDTENFVPADATIQSAVLTLTLRSSESDTRTLGEIGRASCRERV